MNHDPGAFVSASRRVASGADARAEAAGLVAAMTLGEKLDCLDGDTPFWPGLVDMTGGGYYEHTWPAAAVPRLGIPGIEFADGPRGCVVGNATCFPVAMARGASFDPDLEERVGAAIGAELRASGATFTGAVCMNLLRHPAWGRAQETYGEDPHHVGEMAAAATRGLQRHVLVSMKHFAANSMENARFTVDVTLDERALHEVYLPHFARVAGEGVAAVMSAYNSVNGEWCGQNRDLLTDILRTEWGWDGFVISDFIFGLRDPVASVRAGLNIEMPFRQQRAMALAEAVDSGELEEDALDALVVDIVATLLRFADRVMAAPPPLDILAGADHRRLAHEAATASMVLVHNQGLLPLAAAELTKVAVLGPLAATANLGDGGSSDVHPPSVSTPLDGLVAALPDAEIVHAERDVSVIDDADVVVVVVGYTRADEGEFVGQPDTAALLDLFPPADHPVLGFAASDPSAEAIGDTSAGPPESGVEGVATSEGFAVGGDRRSLRLSGEDEHLITEATGRHDRVVVVVMGGSAVVMPWVASTAATLFVWYPGMEGGAALADVLLGGAEPGGRLPFAVPADEADLVPFDPDAVAVEYGLLHGQWWLDAAGVTAAFPFGYGLGYTTFAVRDVDAPVADRVTCSVVNTGSRAGSTVVQVYAAVPESRFERPPWRLVGFAKVAADAGARVPAQIALDRSALRIRSKGTWLDEAGPLRLHVGLHAADAGTEVMTNP